MVNFGVIAAEIVSLVWVTPANFNGFRVLAALLHGTPVLGVSQTLWRWTKVYIWQGGHHVVHQPTFLVTFSPRLVSAQRSQNWCLPYFNTWCANLECRSELCGTHLVGNAGPKNSQKNRHLGTIAQICRAISSQLRDVSISSNISSTCPQDMLNFGPLAAEMDPVVWGTPANFNGFRLFAALLHGTPVLDVSQTLQRWTEGATYIQQGGHYVGHILVMAALCNRCRHYIFALWFLSSFFFVFFLA